MQLHLTRGAAQWETLLRGIAEWPRALRGYAWLFALLSLSAPQPAYCQGATLDTSFAYVTNVSATQLSNAVRLNVGADGTVRLRVDDALYLQFLDPARGYDVKPVRRFHFRLDNCRSKVGSFKPVGLYPIDHLEFAIPQDAQNGVGLDVTVVLDTAAVIQKLDQDNFSSGSSLGPSISIGINPDRRSLTITVTSDLFPEVQPIHKTAGDAGTDHELSVVEQDGLLDLRVRNEPLNVVARMIGALTGVGAAVDPSANRLISAVLNGQRPETALTLLADAYGLQVSMVDGTFLFVDPLSGESGGRGVTVVPLRHREAEQTLSLLPVFLLHFSHVDTQNNAVVIGGSTALRAKVAADLAELDRPSPQCRVGATFLSYTSTADFERTLELARRTSNSTAAIAAGAAGGPSGLMVYTRSSPTSPGIDVTLNALSRNSDLRIVARPSLLLSNGQEGTLFGGQSYYVVLNSRRFGSSGLQHVDVGTTLTVTPQIGTGDWITLQIQIQSSDATVDPASHLPLVGTRKVTDHIRIRSGDTVYIGGLEQLLTQTQKFKIPILGDLPLIGHLFRGRREHQETTQVAVLVTPTIGDDSGSSLSGASPKR